MQRYTTREDWLKAAVEILGPRVEHAAGVTFGLPVLPLVSWPKAGRGVSKHTIGQCFPEAWTPAGQQAKYVTVSPILDEPARVLDVLLHELVHAVGKTGHGKAFGKVARAVGLTGKMTATVASDPLRMELVEIAGDLGDYPHIPMLNHSNSARKRKQYRWSLFVSPVDAEFIIKMKPSLVDEYGAPLCPMSKRRMVPLDGGDDD